MSDLKAQRVQKIVLVELMGAAPSFNLPHETYCRGSGKCHCTSGEVPQLNRDERGLPVRSIVRRRRPKSITLAPRGKSKPLHPAALECDEVYAALHSTPCRVRSEPVK